jgi:hypothetical protein
METDNEYKTNIEEVLEKERDKNTNFDFFKINNEINDYWGYDCNIETISIKPLYLQEFGQKSNELVFTIKQSDWMDPKSLCLEFEMAVTNDIIYRFDGSCHSLFSEMTIFINDIQVENIKDYGKVHAFMSDVKLSKAERVKRIAEGFGINNDGDNEALVYNADTYRENPESKLKYINELNPFGNNNNNNNVPPEKTITEEMINSDEPNNNKKLKFLIKVESAIIGNRISDKNWKLIPLSEMKIQIVFRISNNWGFIPLKKTFNGDIPGNNYFHGKQPDLIKGDEKIFLFNQEHIKNISEFQKQNSNEIKSVKIVNPMIKFSKYTFSEDWNEKMISIYKSQSMINEYISFDIVLNKWIEKADNNNIITTVMLARPQDRVRSMYVTAYNSEVKNAIGRRLSRRNLGFSIFQIQGVDRNWPIDQSFDNTEVICPSGNKSIKPIIEKILRLNNVSKNEWSTYKSYDLIQKDKFIINEKNVSSLFDYSYLFSIDDFWGDNGCKLNNKVQNEVSICKWMNILKFDGVPFSNDKVIGGINIDGLTDTNFILKRSETFKISVKSLEALYTKVIDCNDGAKKNSVLNELNRDFYLTMFMESDVRVMLTYDGKVSLI